MKQHTIRQPSPFMMFVSGLLAMVMAGCATKPFNMEGVNQAVTPQQTIDNKSVMNIKVVWGGMIVATRNFKETSQIEMLTFPLNSNGEPLQSAQPQGRFLIRYDGFLEPAQYSSGRFLSALGTVQPSVAGKIGEADYRYPVIKAEQLHLWEQYRESDSNTQFHFGIGIGIGL
jgi:outer membrane lipoprotein